VRLLNEFEITGTLFIIMVDERFLTFSRRQQVGCLECHKARRLTRLHSLERIQHYITIEQEPKLTEAGVPPAYWPASGDVRIENMSASYSQVWTHFMCVVASSLSII
jgi:hypothetical protein